MDVEQIRAARARDLMLTTEELEVAYRDQTWLVYHHTDTYDLTVNWKRIVRLINHYGALLWECVVSGFYLAYMSTGYALLPHRIYWSTINTSLFS